MPTGGIDVHDTPDLAWFALTSRQRSIWLDLQTSGSFTNFQAGVHAELRQPIDMAQLRAAVDDVMDRHDALRLRIDHRQPRQRIEVALEPPVELIDLSNEPEPRAAALALIREMFTQPYPIDRSPLFQFLVIRLGDAHHHCLLRMHHITLDAISLSMLFKDIALTYDALTAAGQGPGGTSSYLPFQAADAAYSQSPRFRRDLDYWQQRLVALPDGMFNARESGNKGTDRPGVVTIEADAGDYARFIQYCADAKLRVGNTLFALMSVLLASATGRMDMVLGIAIPGRNKDTRSTIGLFSSVLPLRLDIAVDDTVPTLSAKITELLGRDYLHYQAPIDEICRRIGLVQRRRQNVFDVMISYMPLEVVDLSVEFASELLRPLPIRGPDANPLAIYASEINEGRPLTLEFAFNRDYLELEEVEALSKAFGRLLASFAAEPTASIGNMLSTLEPRRGVEAASSRPTFKPADHASEEPHFRVLSSFTADPVVAPFKFWLSKLGLDGKVSLADYNQVFQELVDPASPTRRNRLGANILLVRPEDWLRERAVGFGQTADREDDLRFLTQTVSELVIALAKAASASSVPFILMICPPSPAWEAEAEFGELQTSVMTQLRDGLDEANGVHLFTYLDCRDLYPVATEYDVASDRLGHLPYTTPAFTAFATLIARKLHLLARPPVKVIVVDCDNTLWGGVIAEDGIGGISIGAQHLALQRRLVDAAGSGVLVCLCSKNIEADVLAVFDRRDDMVLKREHVVAHRINWKPKSDNLRSLADALNLGLDSFVMLDDNPIEIGEIEANCPNVLAIPCVAQDAAPALRFDHLWPLDSRSASFEDRKRVERYQQNALRNNAREAAADYRDFIEGLDLSIRVEPPNDADLARLAQLTERTNQFNINGHRLSVADLNAKRRTDGHAVLCVFVADKFGDYGLVGLLAAHRHDDATVVDALLMSCRVLGRGVEHRMIAELGRLASRFGAGRIHIPVRVTERNLPVRQFLESLDALTDRTPENELHVVSRSSAEACSFHPELTEIPDLGETVEAGPTPSSVRHVNGDGWVEIAGALAAVDAIADAVREATAARRVIAPTAHRLAETATEKVLAEMLRESLGVDEIGVDDDFFDLGLHSLLAVQLVSRLRERLGVQLPVRSLFEASTIAKLAAEIDSDTRGSGYQPLVPLQLGNGRSPIFCCHPGNGDAVGYMRLMNALGPDQAVYGFEASGLAPGETLAGSLEEMARVYVKAMITAYPSGPYNMIGWSFGGGLAFEMARQIEAAGREVGVLAFMDSVAPGTRGTDAEEVELTDDLLLDGLTEQIKVLGHHFKVPVTGSTNERLGWGDVMENFQRFGVVPKGYTPEDMRRKMAVFSNCVILFSRYAPAVIKAPIFHFRALEKLGDWDYNWGPYTAAGVHNIRVRCNHFLMGFEPHVNKVAKHLAAALQGEPRKASWYVEGTGVLHEHADKASESKAAA